MAGKPLTPDSVIEYTSTSLHLPVNFFQKGLSKKKTVLHSSATLAKLKFCQEEGEKRSQMMIQTIGHS
jgi:hypothetical protein